MSTSQQPAGSTQPQKLLRLYISGASPRSMQAVRHIREICRTHLSDCDVLQIFDIYQQCARAAADEVVVTPTLIKLLPQPVRRFTGDMSNTREIIAALDLAAAPKEPAATPPKSASS